MVTCRRQFLRSTLGTIGYLATGSIRPGLAVERKDPAGPEPSYLKLDREGELAKRAEALWEVLKDCQLCPRKCRIKRLAGESKICRSTEKLKVHSASAHFGEEKPLVGRHGSGTIFFSNCSLLCCFCQNWEIAHRGDGSAIDHKALARAMVRLQEDGCHNINLVTPSHVVPHIVRALRYAIQDGLRIPLVYNTGGYDRVEILRLLEGIVDIYLPDFKYFDGRLAQTYSAEAGDYPEVAAAAIQEMRRQVGDLRTDASGVAVRGLMVRHLVMPNNVAGTDRFVSWVARNLSLDTYVNLMAQYRPAHKAFDHPEISRRITLDEWQQALRWAKEAGLRNLDR